MLMGCMSSQKKFQRYRPKIEVWRKIYGPYGPYGFDLVNLSLLGPILAKFQFC